MVLYGGCCRQVSLVVSLELLQTGSIVNRWQGFFQLFGKGPWGLLLWEFFGVLTEFGKISSIDYFYMIFFYFD